MRESQPRMQPKIVEARDKRYEHAKLSEQDIQQLKGTLSLTDKEWEQYDPSKKSSIIEFVTQTLAEEYAAHLKLGDSEKQEQENKAVVQKAFKTYYDALQAFTLYGNAEFELLRQAYADLRDTIFEMLSVSSVAPYVNALVSAAEGYYDEVVDAKTFSVDDIDQYPAFVKIQNEVLAHIHPYSHLRRGVNRRHDWVHRAEEKANGVPHIPFVNEDPRQVALDPKMNLAELYPTLFLSVTSYTTEGKVRYSDNITMALRDNDQRDSMRRSFTSILQQLDTQTGTLANAYREVIQMLSQPAPLTATERQFEYETYLQCIEVIQLRGRIPHPTEADYRRVYDIYNDMSVNGTRPQRYADFAQRAFRDESIDDPYFWADEIAALIEEGARVATGQQASRFNS